MNASFGGCKGAERMQAYITRSLTQSGAGGIRIVASCSDVDCLYNFGGWYCCCCELSPPLWLDDEANFEANED